MTALCFWRIKYAMKKAISFLLIFLMMISAAGCRGKDNPQDKAESYAELIFDNTRVHTIDISMSEEDRADQLANPKDKTKYKANVVIDGEEIKDVAFSTKGNSSLYFVVEAGKDKFSYGLNFGKYVDGQTFHGLDKLSLQNNCSDATAMKEYMAYWLFDRMGVDAPLASYVWLTVNGEVQGLYTALEGVEESFLDRTKAGEGTIYKPEDGDMALTDEEMERIKTGESAAHDNGGGADLAYKDDNEESYPDIFENAETDDDAETRARVIRALKALSGQEELDKYLDTEEIIRYFAVHDYLVAYDSYTGPMLHNYCLYENDGRLAMLPWDYDIAFGSFPADARMDAVVDSNAVVNAGIDSPLGGIADEARPMWNWILSDESYLNEYHEVLSELVSVIDSGAFKEESARVHDLILPYIEKDPKAYYTSDKCQKAYETLLKFTELRAESVLKQVNGQLPARSELQADEDKVDASEIVIRDMGSAQDLLNQQEAIEPANEPESRFVFQPKVCSVYMEEVFGKTMCETWFNLVDAVMAGEDTFACPNQYTYDWVMGQFRRLCFPVLTELIDYPYDRNNSVVDGIASFTYLVPREEAAARIEEFAELIEGILNESMKTDYSDFEKAFALYDYFSKHYEYDFETNEKRLEANADYTTTYRLFKTGMGICSEISPAYSYLLMQAGVEATTMMGGDHEWSYVRINGHNYHVDPTFVLNDPGSLSYFMMTDEQRETTGYSKDVYIITSNYAQDHPHPDYAADDGTFSLLWNCCYEELFPDENKLRCWHYAEGWEKDYLEFDYSGFSDS